MSMAEITRELRLAVDDASQRLSAMPDDKASHPVAPGKWSPKEIIGHLIDSASNNHGRFVRAQLTDDLFFPGYDQEAWVRVQQYSAANWIGLVTLWRGFNHHIANIVERIPADIAQRQRTHHNLDQIAWKTVPTDNPVTLEYFVRDYIAHLKHHLSQIPE
jgi:DinB family protein